MPSCTFYHPDIPSSGDGSRPGPYLGSLQVSMRRRGAIISTLLRFPTYGGEVVQILSCNIGELNRYRNPSQL
jgi:hypothetical protein